ncbi:hypothetical protein ONQ60_27185, partial [Salmonella enterica subsp. enterica serovar Virginia]|nr:hypothetical protein [Salmonella enterica subsp. enterica serovar Virginia]
FLPTIGELAGVIVCAKSPSCGMERVRLYDEKGNRGRKAGTGLYIHASLDIQTVKIRKRNMTDKQLDTKLVNAGRSKKYTLGSVN